jgi:LysM repeat protein
MAALCLAVLGDLAPGVAAVKKKSATSDKDGSSKKKDPSDSHSHTVKRGETLWGIARKYEVSVGELMDLNHMPNDSVHEGQVLKIPEPGGSALPPPAEPSTHLVKKGETFRSIAKTINISQAELERANPKVDPDHPKTGITLKIPGHPGEELEKQATPRDPTSTAQVKYTVKENDTYYSIAKAHGLTTKAIAAANPNVKPERLRPGSSLVLPPKPKAEEASAAKKKEDDADEVKPGKAANTRTYTISHGETASSIA